MRKLPLGRDPLSLASEAAAEPPDTSIRSTIQSTLQGASGVLQSALQSTIQAAPKPAAPDLPARFLEVRHQPDDFWPVSEAEWAACLRRAPEVELLATVPTVDAERAEDETTTATDPQTSHPFLRRWKEELPLQLIGCCVLTEFISPMSVQVYQSNLRLAIVPLKDPAGWDRYDESVMAFIRTNSWFVLRGHVESLDLVPISHTRHPEARHDDPLAIPAKHPTALITTGAMGCAIHLTLMSRKTYSLWFRTDDEDILQYLRELLEEDFATRFDLTTFCDKYDRQSDVYLDDDDDCFAVFQPRRFYADFGGLNEECNLGCELCPSYPEQLPLGNLSMTPQEWVEIAAFRARGRIPVLSYRTPEGASMWRCSQPQTSIRGKRCAPDEWLVRYGLSDSKSERVHIFDARPFTNAFVNKLAGAGYESSNEYVGCTVDFASIENIHRVTMSYIQQREQVIKTFDKLNVRDSITGQCLSSMKPSEATHALYGGGWHDHIQSLLKAAYQISYLLHNHQTILVHCSDGWDRTGQLTFLSLIFAEPGCRTVSGFCELLEKEFSWLGHMANTRLGLGPIIGITEKSSDSVSQKSPILLQLLECVWQVMQWNAVAFEFNERLLVALGHHLYARFWGDFAFNSHKERSLARQTYTWRSLLKMVAHQSPASFRNAAYSRQAELLRYDASPLYPMWATYWLRHTTVYSDSFA